MRPTHVLRRKPSAAGECLVFEVKGNAAERHTHTHTQSARAPPSEGHTHTQRESARAPPSEGHTHTDSARTAL